MTETIKQIVDQSPVITRSGKNIDVDKNRENVSCSITVKDADIEMYNSLYGIDLLKKSQNAVQLELFSNLERVVHGYLNGSQTIKNIQLNELKNFLESINNSSSVVMSPLLVAYISENNILRNNEQKPLGRTHMLLFDQIGNLNLNDRKNVKVLVDNYIAYSDLSFYVIEGPVINALESTMKLTQEGEKMTAFIEYEKLKFKAARYKIVDSENYLGIS